jgi:hypothetical protein
LLCRRIERDELIGEKDSKRTDVRCFAAQLVLEIVENGARSSNGGGHAGTPKTVQ